ncbi:tetratricopeptide repeat protein [Plebeiibacterium sediminum]|uniref:Tetratricopeptide repeat protein n=1 Tax=Plebeiibacterium sediminum TaxID=2992112 RepID=A0AAE3M988_9BACT|nr:tetratricopeptide repeat protein [Plebeiobacterium sediminum]MCW3789170.1 tetratricopeptide repeat protein [Plebeiobacterium sediminum]
METLKIIHFCRKMPNTSLFLFLKQSFTKSKLLDFKNFKSLVFDDFLSKSRFVIILFLISITLSTNAQDAHYKALSEAFKVSYAKETAKDYIGAIDVLNKVYEEDSYEINLRMGWLNYLNGLHVEAIKYYKQAIKLKPFAIEPKFGICYPLNASNNVNELIKYYNQALEIAPNNTYALYQLGMVYFNLNQYEKAEKYFGKVVDLFPFDYDGLIMLAHTSFHLKKVREAKVLYHKVLLYNPGDKAATESLKLLD